MGAKMGDSEARPPTTQIGLLPALRILRLNANDDVRFILQAAINEIVNLRDQIERLHAELEKPNEGKPK